jgi:hypothetical protein
MENVYYIKMNIGGLEQNSGILHVVDRIFHVSSVGLIFLKKSVNNMGVKFYNKLPNHLWPLENIQLFRKKLNFFLLQQTFYSIDEYLSYEYLSWKMYMYMKD